MNSRRLRCKAPVSVGFRWPRSRWLLVAGVGVIFTNSPSRYEWNDAFNNAFYSDLEKLKAGGNGQDSTSIARLERTHELIKEMRGTTAVTDLVLENRFDHAYAWLGVVGAIDVRTAVVGEGTAAAIAVLGIPVIGACLRVRVLDLTAGRGQQVDHSNSRSKSGCRTRA